MLLHLFEPDFLPLPLYFVSAASSHLQENVNRQNGFGDISQLLLVLDGEGILYCNGSEYPLKKGCAFYVDYAVPHAYENLGGLVTAWITWRGSGWQDVRTYIGKNSFQFFENVDVKRYVAQIEQIEREYYGRKREGMLSAMLYTLLMSFFEEQNEQVESELDAVLRFMEEHFDQKISVTELARINHSSKSTFCKNFKQRFGCTAFEKLVEIRLLNAKMMLKMNANEKICSIARKCGFDDVSYFCKAYKKKFGVTPSCDQ